MTKMGLLGQRLGQLLVVDEEELLAFFHVPDRVDDPRAPLPGRTGIGGEGTARILTSSSEQNDSLTCRTMLVDELLQPFWGAVGTNRRLDRPAVLIGR